MKKKTVRQRILKNNAWMVIVTFLLFVMINLGIAKIYIETIEHEWKASMEAVLSEDQMEDLVADWTVQQNSFRILVIVDVVVCGTAFLGVSILFTRQLSRHIMEPLEELSKGAKRIREGNLEQAIEYQGDLEFETTCQTFNEMQTHIKEEQEKNRKYEKARTDMIAGISHDLRTPLTAIQGNMKAMIDKVVTKPELQERFLETAYRRSKEMEGLLNQLFYLSKLETGVMPVHLQEVNLVSFVKNYVEGKQSMVTSEEMQLEFQSNQETILMQADLEQLQRIFDNLIENSRKYAQIERLKININLEESEDEIKIEVQDNGAGVEEEKLPYLFDEFYRADESRNKQEGNGLGLYISKCLIEAMHGSILAKNQDGFCVEMRFKRDKKEA